jgi:cytochrome c
MSRDAVRLVLVVAMSMMAGTLAIAQDVAGDSANGEKVFRKCKACHDVGPEAKAKVGPPLTGIIGRTAGTVEGFKYSDAMMAAGTGGLIWSPETIGELIEKPKDFVPGTKMTFAGLRKEEERADVIAYLATFSEE